MNEVYLYFENGIFLEGKSFGASGTNVGEVVFNTSLTGYQEIITDPSYAGQFITFTMPEIGIVGTNQYDFESNGAYARGIIVRNYNNFYSNYRAETSLKELLKSFGIMGICEIDTRFITKMVRDEGAMMMVASTKINNKEELKKILQNAPRIEEENLIAEVTTQKPYIHKNSIWDFTINNYKKALMSDKKIIVIDFGVKRNILNNLVDAGL
jgi:carbamoyl-phosphate synthase small subunit